jgi:hypothetical protein
MSKYAAGRRSAFLWRDWVREVLGVTLGALLVLGAVLYLLSYTTLMQGSAVTGRVDTWSREVGDRGSGSYLIWVVLDDGRKVAAFADGEGRAPRVGEEIGLVKLRTGVKRMQYAWRR